MLFALSKNREEPDDQEYAPYAGTGPRNLKKAMKVCGREPGIARSREFRGPGNAQNHRLGREGRRDARVQGAAAPLPAG